MKKTRKNNGSVLLVVVFASAFLAAITVGILQMTTEEIQLMHNHINSVKAIAAAEAGLNDSLARIRLGTNPNIAGASYSGGSYTVTAGTSAVSNMLITSTGITSLGFTAIVKADVTIGSSSPYTVRIDKLRINE